MESLKYISAIIILTLFFFHNSAMKLALQNGVSRTITVDASGQGDFTKVQQAIDSIPSNNSLWTRILLNHGTYKEKVVIPKDKPYIILEGDHEHLTMVEYGDFGSAIDSSTFKMYADNFVARNILFKNTYDGLIVSDPNGNKTTWAPAALIMGDKASFHRCGFVSLQDTLSDIMGRHFFYSCFVEGAIDFIWGNGQSLYEKCQIRSATDRIGVPGFITAQGREGPNQPTGFVFKECVVNGAGPIFLGRPYRYYSRVLFASTYMENIITPEGWTTWRPTDPVDLITFSEVNCEGPGADMSHRVPWEKKLSDEEVATLTNPASFIDQEGWLGQQPA